MPYEFDFDPVNGILRCRMHGEIAEQDFRDYSCEVFEQVARVAPRAAVFDMSNVTRFGVPTQLISGHAVEPAPLADPRLPRVVIAPAPANFGIGRMFQIWGEETRPNLHVVETPEQAWAILGLKQSPQFAPVGK